MMIKTFAVFLALLNIVNAVLPGTWPPVDKPAPANPEWTKLVDQTKVPNAPRTGLATACTQPPSTFCRFACGCTRAEDIIGCPTKKDWALTFDDGPAMFTPKLVDELNALKIKATFFVIGSRVFEYPDILKKIHESGHEIGAHTWSHAALSSLPNDQIIAEIKYTELAIKLAINVTTTTLRPPYGQYDDRVRAIAKQLGYKLVLWDRNPSDFLTVTDPKYDINWVGGNFTAWTANDPGPTGHISLQHDLYEKTAAVGTVGVPILQKAQYKILPAGVCNNIKAYVEGSVTPPAADPTGTSTASATTTPTPGTAPPASTNGANASAANTSTSLNNGIITSFTSYLVAFILFYQVCMIS